MQLNQVKAIITGGASGLGHAVAQHLVAQGGKVALFDVNEEKGQAAAQALGDAARFFRTDVTSEDGVSANVAAARGAMDGLNVVINCAGILGAGRVLGKEGAMPLAQGIAAKPINTATKIIPGASMNNHLSAAEGIISSLVNNLTRSATV